MRLAREGAIEELAAHQAEARIDELLVSCQVVNDIDAVSRRRDGSCACIGSALPTRCTWVRRGNESNLQPLRRNIERFKVPIRHGDLLRPI